MLVFDEFQDAMGLSGKAVFSHVIKMKFYVNSLLLHTVIILICIGPSESVCLVNVGLLKCPNHVLERYDRKDFDDALLVYPPRQIGDVVVPKTTKQRSHSELVELSTTLFLKHHYMHLEYRSISLQHSPLYDTDRDYYDSNLTEILPNRPCDYLARKMRSSDVLDTTFDQVSQRVSQY